MDNISCNTCLDLMPLIKDSIASDDSNRLFKSHLAGCPHCTTLFKNNAITASNIYDVSVSDSIKKRMAWLFAGTMVAGTLFGLVLCDGAGMFYDVVIMPAIGGFSYLLFKRKSYYVLPALFLVSSIWISIREAKSGLVHYIWSATCWAAIFTALSALGVLIAWLFHYAFRKEGRYDSKN